MSPVNARFGKMRGGAVTTQTVTGVLLIFAVLIVLYYIYRWVSASDPASASTVIVDSANPPIPLSSVGTTKDISPIFDGGQYSVSMWVYVSDTKGFLGSPTKLAHLLEISDTRFDVTSTSPPPIQNPRNTGRTLIFVGLNPADGTLVVRQGTATDGEKIDNTLPTNTNGNYPLGDLINRYNDGNLYTAKDKCDITNGIEYQRWVLITVTSNGKTLDVYVDGKLARSCVYRGRWLLNGSNGNARLSILQGNANNLRGWMNGVNYFNYALNPEEVWRIYMNGPSGPWNPWKWLTSFFQVTVTIDGQNLNTLTPCAACDATKSQTVAS